MWIIFVIDVYKPFAIVDSVSLNSPAESAGNNCFLNVFIVFLSINKGIEVGDKLCKFGKISISEDYDVSAILKDIAVAIQVELFLNW